MSKHQVAEANAQYHDQAHELAEVVPAGYKQAEVGVIPEDWETRAVFDIADNQKSLFDDGDWIEAEHITDKGIRLIQTGNIGVGSYVEKDSKKYIYEASYEKLKCKELMLGDLLICRLAEPAGRACILPDIGESKVITSVDVTIFRPSEAVADRKFLVQYFSSSEWFKSVLEQVGGTTHKRISRGALGKISVPFPSLEEQTAIANALSDVDALINELEKLITKKQSIKTATMQQLLTGRTRLPQFALREDGTPKGYKPSELGEVPEDWEIELLGCLTDKVVGGGTPSRNNPMYWGGEIPWVTVKDFATFNPYTSQESITRNGLKNSASNLIPKGTLVTSTRMALGKAVIYKVDVAINQDMKAIFPSGRLQTGFLYYWFEFNAEKIDDLGSGSTVKGLSLVDLRAMPFLLSPNEEQAAIATILSDIDEEIQTLQQRLNKTCQIKQGMMQELLTGKTRLIKPVQ